MPADQIAIATATARENAATAREDTEKLAARNATLKRQLELARLRPGSDPRDAASLSAAAVSASAAEVMLGLLGTRR